MKILKLSRLQRRLLPLYLAAFCQGFVLWYAIEKLFMTKIGFDDASIGIMVAVYSASMLLTETPSGILADRWSRKGVLIIASILLAVSSVICGLSPGITVYIIGVVLWGMFYALYSGTYDSIVYDVLVEERGNADNYEKYYGRIEMVDSIGLALGSLVGGLVGEWLGLRETYYLTVPIALCAVLALLNFREPLLHKAEAAVPLKQHVVSTFRALTHNKKLLPVLVALVLVGVLSEWMFEFNQLWLIALVAPAVLYGPANALMFGAAGLAGAIAGYIRLHRPPVMMATLVVLAGCFAVLVASRNISLIIVAQFIFGAGAVAIGIMFTKVLHDSLGSNVRAGAASAVSTLGRIVFVPLSLGFGFLSQKANIFIGTWIVIGLAVIMTVFILKSLRGLRTLPPVGAFDQPATETYQK